jgi:hypothetical protein
LPPSFNGTITLDGWRLEHFNKELFWEEPPEGKTDLYYTAYIGLYEVDVGLRQPASSAGLNMMAYEDMNGDKYTDIVTVNDEKNEFTVHLFEPAKKMFMY